MSTQPTDVTVIARTDIAAARAEQRSLVRRVAEQYGVEPEKMLTTLKNTAFKVRDGEVTNEQMMALLIVADAHKLNPFTREIFAFPSQNGIVPVVSVDGWAKLVNDHAQFNGWEFEQDDEKCVCTIYRKDREHPTRITEYMSECIRPTPAWKSHPKRMLRHKALIQAARIAFSFSGVYDPDEAERIVEAEEIDITPAKEGKLSPKKLREVVEALLAATNASNGVELHKQWKALTNDEQQFVWSNLRSWERSAIKKLLDATKNQAPEDIDPWAVECIKTSTVQTLPETWRLVQDAYAERDRETPPDIETVYNDRKQELGL